MRLASRKRRWALIAISAPFLFSIGSVVGGDTSSAVGGEALALGLSLAKSHCAECHAVERGDQSPTLINANTAFPLLSERFPIPMLQEAARSGHISGHDEMPGFDFTAEEMSALLVYIDSFAPGDKRYISR